MPSQSFSATVVRDGPSCFVVLPFDPKAVFGKVRAPVVATVNGYTFRTTIAAMGGPVCIGMRKSHREAAGLEGGERVAVKVTLDEAPRTVTAPADLLRALQALPGALEAWKASSYTHQREHVEAIDGARKPETRERRVAAAVAMVAAKASTPRLATARAAKASTPASRGLAKKR
ncbi:MAG: YdeI/OmpD-associated family protein [Vicinamibacteraceae bacterium]